MMMTNTSSCLKNITGVNGLFPNPRSESLSLKKNKSCYLSFPSNTNNNNINIINLTATTKENPRFLCCSAYTTTYPSPPKPITSTSTSTSTSKDGVDRALSDAKKEALLVQSLERNLLKFFFRFILGGQLHHRFIGVKMRMKVTDRQLQEKVNKIQDKKRGFAMLADRNLRAQTYKLELNEAIDILLENQDKWISTHTTANTSYDVIADEVLNTFFHMMGVLENFNSEIVEDVAEVVVVVSTRDKIVDKNIQTLEEFKEFLQQLRVSKSDADYLKVVCVNYPA